MKTELLRKKDLISYLKTHNFIFDQKEILSQQRLKRQTFSVNQDGQKMIACIVNGDKEVEKRIAIEIEAFRKIGEREIDFVPDIIECSLKNHWYIRKSIDGQVAGDVYAFSKEFINKDGFIEQLIRILLSLSKVRLSSGNVLSFDQIANNVNSALSAAKNHQKLISDFANSLSDKKKLISDPESPTFIHGDLQPTNIIIGRGDKLFVIDFERCKLGHYLFDVASLYHRAEYFPKWQKRFIQGYRKQLAKTEKKFSEEVFNLFWGYFLILDIVSLDVIYLQGRQRPLHDTNIKIDEAAKMISLYTEKLKNCLTK